MIQETAQNNRLRVFVLSIAALFLLVRAVCAGAAGLGDDEAYYWAWAQHLQLSYYDHPAMTAWLIKLGTFVFGDTPFGVRALGLVANAATGFLLYRLGAKLFSPVSGLIGVLLYFVAPIFSLGGILMVPDAPMGVAWVAFLLLLWQMVEKKNPSLGTWFALGLILGLGLLSKYTMALVALSALIFVITDSGARRWLLSPGFWFCVVISVALCLPIIVWNAQLGWPTLSFHLHDRHTGGGVDLNRWGQYWASQAVALGPGLLLIAIVAGVAAIRRWRERNWRFALMVSAPTFVLFSLQALYSEFKPHWPAPAYLIAFLIIGEWSRLGFGLIDQRLRKLMGYVTWISILMLIPISVVFFAGVLYPIIPKIARAVAPEQKWDPKFDPTNDLYGWNEAFARAEEIRKQVSSGGDSEQVFLSSSRYQLVAQIAFVSGEQVWRVSPGRDQYTFWQTRERWAPLIGKNSIFITDQRYERDPRGDGVFDSCEELEPELVYRSGELARRFHFWLCKGFRGLPN